MRRREFLTQAGHGLVVGALMPFGTSVTRAVQGRSSQPVALDTLTADLERQIPDWLSAARVPGLSIVIIQNAGVAWRRSFGMKDAESKTPVGLDTMFEAASMSKPVFAYVVMKLCESGVMGLDVPLTKYVSDRFLESDPRLDLITARHVLSHTTGFQNWRSEKEPLAIRFTPGSQYSYSGEGYNYLQIVVTRLLGQSFETIMTRRLFEPLGMTSSRYLWNEDAAGRMARPHDPGGKATDITRSTESSVARYGSAGALLSTPTDYAKFVMAVIDPKPADAFRLNAASVREMLRPQVRIDGGDYPASWTLGWQVFHNKTRDFIFHGGDNRGFHCAAVASVAGKSGYVAMTNGENGTAVLRNLLMSDRMQEFLLG